MGDKLNGVAVKHWTEAVQPMTGLARIDGRNYRWMGMDPRRGETAPNVAMEQTSVEETPLHSHYGFAAGGGEIKVTFFTAAFPGDLDLLSRPVTYLSWSVASTDGAAH